MKTISDIRHSNLLNLLTVYSTAKIAEALGHSSQSTLSQIINRHKDSRTGKPKNMGDVLARRIEAALSLPEGYMDTPLAQQHDQMLTDTSNAYILELSSPSNAIRTDFTISQGDSENLEGAFEIVYLDAKGSCGGGSIEQSDAPAGKLIKEASWFRKYQLKPKDAVVVYADGDSMADYISDGDMVIFNRSKKEPKSGKIFLINHPDGLRIKQLRREIDGTWVLESRNQDKRKYPDERIHPSMSELLIIEGEFVYRQGG